jgi:hypothetical protein
LNLSGGGAVSASDYGSVNLALASIIHIDGRSKSLAVIKPEGPKRNTPSLGISSSILSVHVCFSLDNSERLAV